MKMEYWLRSAVSESYTKDTLNGYKSQVIKQ